MKPRSTHQVHTVVEVWRGFAVNAFVFEKASDARKCARRLRAKRNLDEDDVEIFQTPVFRQFDRALLLDV